METVARHMTPIPPLGPVTSVRLLSTCPLCRLMFDITYLSNSDLRSIRDPENVDEGQLALVPAWTLVHLDPAQAVWPKKEWGPHAICLYTAVTRAKSRYKPQIGVHPGEDAITVVDVGENGTVILGAEKVDPKTPDYSKIKEWFRRCDALHHITCQPLVSEGLKKIKLVDVETRRIVMYPSGGCDYIALSYVWGGVVQPSYKLGDTLPTIPATLEDAMVVTRHLGKRYIWADSLCIDQGDGAEKSTQIPLMSAIYTGAWATIFNVAAQSARSGLPRVGTLEGVIPQLSCKVGENLLLSLMPPLRAQLSRSLWNTRAWTFQEGLLSPRRLFFTNHQVYFECNVTQCCESIDDTRSAFHLLSDEARGASSRDALDSLSLSGPDEEFKGGVMRDPFRPIFTSKKMDVSESYRIWKYEQLVHSYTSKEMTMDTDALNAFSAILTRFQESHYKKGFVHGLPVEDLPTALLWVHWHWDNGKTEPRRRDKFPSWSWVGWESVATGACASCVRGTSRLRDVQKRHLPPLRVWKAGDDCHPELVYDFSPIQENQGTHEDETDEEDKYINDYDDGMVSLWGLWILLTHPSEY